MRKSHAYAHSAALSVTEEVVVPIVRVPVDGVDGGLRPLEPHPRLHATSREERQEFIRGRHKAAKTAAMWSKQFQIEVTVDDVWCDGCLVEGKKCAHCARCEIRACARDRGVANCGKCDDYACEKLGAFFKMAPMARDTLERVRAG